MSTEINTQKLVSDLKVVVNDAEELLRATASVVGDKASDARVRIQESLKVAKKKLAEAETIVVDKTKQAAKVTDEYVHENPWQAVGIAAGVGFLIGLLIRRR